MNDNLLSIDQGTTSTRAIIFKSNGVPLSIHQLDLKNYYPHSGWVEQDPEEIWQNTVLCCREALRKSKLNVSQIAGVGITNQRETTIIWNKNTSKPIAKAIVWLDRRTVDICRELSKLSINSLLQNKTGLILDPYFSATKIIWLLENVKYAREFVDKGELAFGTIDTFLLWRLTNGRSHSTDATNASRTLLFNIRSQEWDNDILKAFKIPKIILPKVLDCSSDFGYVDEKILGGTIPISGIAGDQQAAAVGQACFNPGMVKSTLGTGCFMLMNTGSKLIKSNNKLLSTVAYRLDNKVTYGLEGTIFSAGVTIKWLRDKLKIIKTAAETESLANNCHDTGGIYVVPGFSGLGAPYWDPDAKGALLGLTASSSIPQIVRAALESVCYQSKDLLMAMYSDSRAPLELLRVDGGMAANNWLLQFLSDILSLNVQRPSCIETTAQGAAYLAGLQIGVYKSLDEISSLWRINSEFIPQMIESKVIHLYSGWKEAVSRVLTK
ncbi:glycerol kinase GlpK [Gammaproteobacteria bacterium]|nr:glycerol kinase GlpK [Gammaproteobacteria bacterium]